MFTAIKSTAVKTSLLLNILQAAFMAALFCFGTWHIAVGNDEVAKTEQQHAPAVAASGLMPFPDVHAPAHKPKQHQ